MDQLWPSGALLSLLPFLSPVFPSQSFALRTISDLTELAGPINQNKKEHWMGGNLRVASKPTENITNLQSLARWLGEGLASKDLPSPCIPYTVCVSTAYSPAVPSDLAAVRLSPRASHQPRLSENIGSEQYNTSFHMSFDRARSFCFSLASLRSVPRENQSLVGFLG